MKTMTTMTKAQWADVAFAALVNAGIVPSAASHILSEYGLDREDSQIPTAEDWQAAFDSGGMRISVAECEAAMDRLTKNEMAGEGESV